MVITNRPRPLRRDRNGILFYLHMEDWPDDIPLPGGTEVFEMSDGAFWPYWNIILEPDRTVELVFGWFIVPGLSIEETFRWYQAEMEKLGWVEVERADTLPAYAMLRYCHPQTDPGTETYVVVSIRRNRYLNRTQPMIRRVTIYPWSPPEPEEESEIQDDMPEAEIPKDEHGLGEGTVELLEKLAITMSRLLGGDGIGGFPGAADLEE